MKNLGDTYLFRSEEKVGRTFREDIKKIDWERDKVDADYFSNEIKIINRRYSYTLRPLVINAYETDRLVCFYSDYVKMTKLVPIFLMKNKFVQNDISAIVNLEAVGATKRKTTEEIEIDVKKLYGFLETAFISRELQSMENKFLMNTKIRKLSTDCYVTLFRKVLDKMYAVNLMPDKADKISFVLAKFFLIYVLELPPSGESINEIAYSCTSGDLTKNQLFSLDLEFGPDTYSTLDGFIKALADYFDVLRQLNLGTLIRQYMTMYGEDALFSLECYQRLLEVIITSCIFEIRGFKDQILDKTLGKKAMDLYTEITRVSSR